MGNCSNNWKPPLLLGVVAIMTIQVILLEVQRQPSVVASVPEIRKQYRQYTKTFPREINMKVELPLLRTGATVDLGALTAGKTTILSFLSFTCYQCLQDLHKWMELDKELQVAENVKLIFIASGPSRQYVMTLFNRYPKFSLPVLYDSTESIVRSNNIPEVPATVLLNTSGQVVLAGSPVLRPEVHDMYVEYLNNLEK